MHASVADAIKLVYPGALDERAVEISDHLLKAGFHPRELGTLLERMPPTAVKKHLPIQGWQQQP
jgi:hypothetical protein